MEGSRDPRQLVAYQAPHWTSSRIEKTPKYRLKLGHMDTPIQVWRVPGLPTSVQLSIKRDDMTGCALSGNKVRKLEFLLAHALEMGCKHVISCGRADSNHCRAVAVAAAIVGLKPHLLLRSDTQLGFSSNMLINRLVGATCYIAPDDSPYPTEMTPRMLTLQQILKQTKGEESMLIPVGGSDSLGMFGYIDAFEELLKQGILENFDDIVFACGSGGTGDGLAIANYLSGAKLGIHAIAVDDDAAHFHAHLDTTLKEVGLYDIKGRDILDVMDSYKGAGYRQSTEQELDFLTELAEQTGIILDRVYSGKAMFALVMELNKNPVRFKGSRILFIHTGGLFSAYDGRADETLRRKENIYMWPDKNKPPFKNGLS